MLSKGAVRGTDWTGGEPPELVSLLRVAHKPATAGYSPLPCRTAEACTLLQDADLQVILNLYIRQEQAVTSHLTELTG